MGKRATPGGYFRAFRQYWMMEKRLMSRTDRISGKVIHKSALFVVIPYLAFNKKRMPTSSAVGST